MSRLEELLRQHCPNGVEYKRLSDIAIVTRGGNLQKKDFIEDGVPCIHYGQIYTKYGLFTDKAFTFVSEEVALRQRFAQHGDIVMAVTSENIEDVCKCVVWLGDKPAAVSGHTAVISHNQNPKYLAYCFSSSLFFEQKKKLAHGTKVIEVTPDKLSSVVIPVPPLLIQDEIVSILDSYSNMETELQERIKEEVLLRKQQYEFCCDRLFDQCDSEKVALSELAKTNIGLATSVTKHKTEKGVILLHNSDIVPNKIVIKKTEYITEEFAQKNSSKILREGDVITVHTGDVGTSAVITKEFDGAIGFTTITSRIKDLNRIIPEYYCRYLNSRRCKEEIEKMTISDRSNLNQRSFEKLMIPVPGIVEQERIVSSLEMIDKAYSQLLKDLNNEIIARQKQYDYYRDKILTFKPLES